MKVEALRADKRAVRADLDRVTEERTILQKATKYFAAETNWWSASKFVEDHRGAHEVKRMCQVLGIQRSSFYKWQAGRQARLARRQADDAVVARIQDHHQEWNHTLGYRRMTVELNAEQRAEERLNHKRVARLMRANHIVGVHLRKPKTTTVKDPDAQVSPT